MVVMTVPAGVATVPWLVDSGWIALADKEKFLLYVFEPGSSGTWGSCRCRAELYRNRLQQYQRQRQRSAEATWYLPPES